MTVETTTARVTYTGAGTTGPFSVPFYFLKDEDLKVIKTTIADGTETTLVLTTDYVVSGAADEAGGSVTLTASLSSAYKLTIIRDPDLLQSSDYPPNDKFPATTHERVVDKLTMIAQRLKDLINRSFRLSDGDVSGISLSLSNLSASKLIAVNSAGTALEAVAAADVGLTPVSDFAATLLDDADAPAALTTLGVSAFAQTLLDDASASAARTTLGLGNAATGTIGTDVQAYNADIPTVSASQAEMEAGTESALRSMSPLRVAQAIAALAPSSVITLGTPQATTSGTSIDFTGIPSGTKLIVVSFEAVSTSGTSIPLVQLGDSGGVETSGYAGSIIGTALTDGFRFYTSWVASAVANGSMLLTHVGSNTWAVISTVALTGATGYSGGTKTLSGELDRIRLTTVGGTDTFDAGKVNILCIR